jgi:hypothetical protein
MRMLLIPSLTLLLAAPLLAHLLELEILELRLFEKHDDSTFNRP